MRFFGDPTANAGQECFFVWVVKPERRGVPGAIFVGVDRRAQWVIVKA